MEVKLLNGGIARLRLKNKIFNIEIKSKSKFQHNIGQQLLHQYPHYTVFTEIIIPNDGFILDFFIPSLNLVIECHGRQHNEHIRYFHKTKKEFHKQQKIDQIKRDWCKLNDFRLIEIYDE